MMGNLREVMVDGARCNMNLLYCVQSKMLMLFLKIGVQIREFNRKNFKFGRRISHNKHSFTVHVLSVVRSVRSKYTYFVSRNG
jgi:hypothetical protein